MSRVGVPRIAAEVTASVEEGSSDGNVAGGPLGIRYEPVGGSTVTEVNFTGPRFQAPADSSIDQTVSGAVGNLAAGDYIIGMRQESDTADLQPGDPAGTIIMAETASGVSSNGIRRY